MTAVDDPVLAFLNPPLAAVLGFAAGTLLVYVVVVPLGCWRDRRQQLRQLEDQMWRENLSDWQREALERADRQRAETRREARRRLGSPEEE